MFLIRRPSDDFIIQAIEAQRDLQLTYSHIGKTRESQCPSGFFSNHSQSVIGSGEECFQRAKDAIFNCRMLNLGWLQVVSTITPITEGSLVCTLLRIVGLYSLNVARVVYIDDDEKSERFGFGYGTLSEYPVSGEERFTVSFNRETGEVSFELFSFSKPSSSITRIGWPLARRTQRRFCRDATEAMIAAASVL